MALYRRPGSPFYWSKLYVHGDVVRFSTGERTKIAALRKEREEAARFEKAKNVEGRYTIATLTAKFLVWKAANNRKASSIRAMRKHVELHILPFFGEDRDVRDITAADLEEYKTDRGALVTAATVGKELSTLRQVLRYAADIHKLMEQAPTTRNPTHRYEPKWRLFTRDELGRLLHELGKMTGRGRDALPYFALMANTGMRGGELEQLTWDMVDLSQLEIRLPGSVTKSRRPRVVPIGAGASDALGLIRSRRDPVGRVFHTKRFYDSWRKACRSAGVWPARPHDLRHTFGSMLHRANRPGPEIRDILGHVTLSMENLYAHTHREQLHEAVASVPAIRASVPVSVPFLGQNVPKKASNCQIRSGGKKATSPTRKQ